jgi:nitric oxide reductase activation protein
MKRQEIARRYALLKPQEARRIGYALLHATEEAQAAEAE